MAGVPGSLPLELGAPFAIGVALDLWHWYRLHRSQQLWARLEAHSSSAMSLRPGTAGSAAVAAAIVAGAAAAGPVEPEPELGAQTESAPQAQCVVLVKRDGKNAVIGRQQSSPWALVVEARREATEPTKRTITLGEKTSASVAWPTAAAGRMSSRKFCPRRKGCPLIFLPNFSAKLFSIDSPPLASPTKKRGGDGGDGARSAPPPARGGGASRRTARAQRSKSC